MIDIEVYSRIFGNAAGDTALNPVVLKLFQEEITVAELIERTVEEQTRALYLLTPAQQETGWFSNRFAGQTGIRQKTGSPTKGLLTSAAEI